MIWAFQNGILCWGGFAFYNFSYCSVLQKVLFITISMKSINQLNCFFSSQIAIFKFDV